MNIKVKFSPKKLLQAKSLIIIISVIGFFWSLYLVYEHYQERAGVALWCDLGSNLSCSKVLTSVYSTVFGIPLGALGAFWFLGVLYLINSDKLPKLPKFIKTNSGLLLVFWGILAVASEFFLIFVEIFVLNSICLLCTIDHILIDFVFILSILNFRKQ